MVSISLICGTHRGLTNDPTTMCRNPVADSASSSATLSATAMSALSICMPSRMPLFDDHDLGMTLLTHLRIPPRAQ